jgi:preprotein translocase subunit SecE
MTVDEVTNNTQEQQNRTGRRRRNREAAAVQAQKAIQAAQKDRATPVRREDRGNFVTRFFRGIADYFSSTRAEIQKVAWPTRQESLRLSGIVLAVTIISSIALGLLDYLYGELFRLGLNAPIIFGVVAVVVIAVVVGVLFVSRRT